MGRRKLVTRADIRAVQRLLSGRPKRARTPRVPAGSFGGLVVLAGLIVLGLVGAATDSCSSEPPDSAASRTPPAPRTPPQPALDLTPSPAPPTTTPTPSKRRRRPKRDESARAPMRDQTCCKVCSNSQPCGNSCIPYGRTCHKGVGCAC